MIGEDYFDARESLVSLAERVLELADKTDTDQSELRDAEVERVLYDPFLFIVCGAAGSGKSSFFNGLCGGALCSSGSMESTKVHWYRHGEEYENRPVTPLLEESYRPVEFLKRYNVIDTPGLDSDVDLDGGAGAIIERFLPTSDLVFWVLPVSDPWGGAMWDFFASQPEEILKRSVIIIQKADLKNAEDLEMICGHVSELARQRLGFDPPTFTVSGEAALKGKRGELSDSDQYSECGYFELEQFIEQTLTKSEFRRLKLASVRKAIADVLRKIEVTIAQRTKSLYGNEQFLSDLEAEVDDERMKHASNFGVHFSGMRDVFGGRNIELKQELVRELRVCSTIWSLLIAENTAKKVEVKLKDAVEIWVKDQADVDGRRLIDDCHAHWATVCPRVKDRLSIRMKDFDDSTDGFDQICKRFSARMGRSARRAIDNLRIRKSLSKVMVKRREHLKNWLYLAFTLLLAAGVCGSLSLGSSVMLPWWLLLASVLTLIIFAVRAYITGKKVARVFDRMLDDSSHLFSQGLERDYRDGIRGFYVKYGDLLGSVRLHILQRQRELKPNLAKRSRLFLELMIIEQDH